MINYNELFEKSKELAKASGLTQLELYQRFSLFENSSIFWFHLLILVFLLKVYNLIYNVLFLRMICIM